MSSLKSLGPAILALSLVFQTLTVPVGAEGAGGGAGRSAGRYVGVLVGDGSCDEPVERAVFTGYLFDPVNAFAAEPDRGEDDDDQGDQLGRAPTADATGFILRHDPPRGGNAVSFDVVIRGKKRLLAVFSRAGPARHPAAAEEESQRASLLLQGPRAAAMAGLDTASGRHFVAPDASLAAARRPFPRFAVPVASLRGHRLEAQGPAISAPRSTSRAAALDTLVGVFPKTAEADHPPKPSMAAAPAHAPAGR